MSDEKFIERSMYGGKGDKNPKKPLIIAILIAIFVIGVGIWQYFEITRWEQEGGTVEMNRLINFIYDIAGAIGVLLFFVAFGVFMLFSGYSSYKNKKGE